jgi:UDP-N-acetylenolpyruvoylglucosamine reductase
MRLKEFVQRRVHERFGVELRPEPVMLGFGT